MKSSNFKIILFYNNKKKSNDIKNLDFFVFIFSSSPSLLKVLVLCFKLFKGFMVYVYAINILTILAVYKF